MLAMALPLVSSCSPPGPTSQTMPMNHQIGDIWLDFGTMAVKPLLRYGWGSAEQGEMTTFRWIKALEADLVVSLSIPDVDWELWLVASPLYLPYTRQRIAVSMNGRYIGEWLCADHSRFAVYHMKIPASSIRGGENRLRFRMGYRKRLRPGKRALSVRVDELLLRPLDKP